jgi:hypothetical protein
VLSAEGHRECAATAFLLADHEHVPGLNRCTIRVTTTQWEILPLDKANKLIRSKSMTTATCVISADTNQVYQAEWQTDQNIVGNFGIFKQSLRIGPMIELR